ncbi:phosphatidic acid phosphatase [Spirochaetia bacterium]|nr:phosphatidic acid phosphatase [Spirochaetia bacterium]
MNTFEELSLSAAASIPNPAGLEWVRHIQTIASPPLTIILRIITNLVSEYVFLIVLMVLYWLWNERRAFWLGLTTILAVWLNETAKNAFKMPRPFHLDSSLGMIHENGYGFPSGHAQLSLTLLVVLAAWFAEGAFSKKEKPPSSKKIIVWICTVVLVLLVAFSRLYLGVHFPWDIAGGWLLGGLVLVLFFLFPRIFAILPKPTGKIFLAAAGLTAFCMNAVYPHNSTSGALFFGFSAGYIVMQRFFPFTAYFNSETQTYSRIKPAVVFFTGFMGLVLFYLLLKALFPGPDSSFYQLFRFIRYALVGFWASGGAPWLFKKLPFTNTTEPL